MLGVRGFIHSVHSNNGIVMVGHSGNWGLSREKRAPKWKNRALEILSDFRRNNILNHQIYVRLG